jgi:hypothetical protein
VRVRAAQSALDFSNRSMEAQIVIVLEKGMALVRLRRNSGFGWRSAFSAAISADAELQRMRITQARNSRKDKPIAATL